MSNADINNDKGSIKIADDVVGVIAGLAATEVEGSRHEWRHRWWNCRDVRAQKFIKRC